MSILESYDKVTLGVLLDQFLMKRKEVKFFFSNQRLSQLLYELKPFFDVLEVEGKTLQKYDSYYFDTVGFDMYLNHHNRRVNRYKIRFRDYVDSKISFFEVKFKDNKRQTHKSRISVPFKSRELTPEVKAFLSQAYDKDISLLVHSISTSYERLTLVSKDRKARLTLDSNVVFKSKGAQKKLDNLTIMELKYSPQFNFNFYLKLFKNLALFRSPISKYCTGITYHNSKIKKNSFLQTLRKISSITNKEFI